MDRRTSYHHLYKLHEALLKTTKHSLYHILACCNALEDYDKKPLKYDALWSALPDA